MRLAYNGRNGKEGYHQVDVSVGGVVLAKKDGDSHSGLEAPLPSFSLFQLVPEITVTPFLALTVHCNRGAEVEYLPSRYSPAGLLRMAKSVHLRFHPNWSD